MLCPWGVTLMDKKSSYLDLRDALEHAGYHGKASTVVHAPPASMDFDVRVQDELFRDGCKEFASKGNSVWYVLLLAYPTKGHPGPISKGVPCFVEES